MCLIENEFRISSGANRPAEGRPVPAPKGTDVTHGNGVCAERPSRRKPMGFGVLVSNTYARRAELARMNATAGSH